MSWKFLPCMACLHMEQWIVSGILPCTPPFYRFALFATLTTTKLIVPRNHYPPFKHFATYRTDSSFIRLSYHFLLSFIPTSFSWFCMFCTRMTYSSILIPWFVLLTPCTNRHNLYPINGRWQRGQTIGSLVLGIQECLHFGFLHWYLGSTFIGPLRKSVLIPSTVVLCLSFVDFLTIFFTIADSLLYYHDIVTLFMLPLYIIYD